MFASLSTTLERNAGKIAFPFTNTEINGEKSLNFHRGALCVLVHNGDDCAPAQLSACEKTDTERTERRLKKFENLKFKEILSLFEVIGPNLNKVTLSGS